MLLFAKSVHAEINRLLKNDEADLEPGQTSVECDRSEIFGNANNGKRSGAAKTQAIENDVQPGIIISDYRMQEGGRSEHHQQEDCCHANSHHWRQQIDAGEDGGEADDVSRENQENGT